MDFQTYFRSLPPAGKQALADACETSVKYLHRIASIRRPLGAEFCVAIEKFSQGACGRRDIRPDDYWLIWPELGKPRKPPKAPSAAPAVEA